MKPKNSIDNRRLPFLALAVLLAGWLLGGPVFNAGGATVTWTNSAGDLQWSTAVNWDSNAVPTATDDVRFTSLGSTNVLGAVNNVVDTSMTITNMLAYQAPVSFITLVTNYHTTYLNPGVTLLVTNALANGVNLLYVGGGDTTTDPQWYYTIKGGAGASLVLGDVSNPGTASSVQVSGTGSGVVGANKVAQLDMSGLDNFSFAGSLFWVGHNASTAGNAASDRPVGRVYLARTNVIIANATIAARSDGAFRLSDGKANQPAQESLIELGQQNTIQTDFMKVGGNKSGAAAGGRMYFRSGLVNPTLKMRGASGGTSRIAQLRVGSCVDVTSGSTGAKGTLDLTGGTADILATTMDVAKTPSGTTTTAPANGTVTLTAGTLDVTTLNVGIQTGNAATSVATGVINVQSNATLVANAVTLANDAGSATGTGIGVLNIVYGGQVTVTNSIAETDGASGNASSTINITNGTLKMMTGTITVDTVQFNNGTVQAGANQANFLAVPNLVVQSGGATINDGGFSITNTQPLRHDPALGAAPDGGLTKTGNGTDTLTVAATYTGGTTISAGKLALRSSGAINSSARISIAAGATFDVSALASPYNLSSSTELRASGTGTTLGSTAAAIIGASGGTVNLGTQPITLAYDGANPALYVSQGTLQVQGNAWTINGSPLTAGTTYTIASQASGTVSLSGSHTAYGTALSGLTATVTTDGGANVQLTTSAALTATTTALSSSGDNNTYGLGPTFTATVSAADAGGTVLFVIDGVPQLPPAAVSSGVATLTVNPLPAGTHAVLAQYSGDVTYGASVSAALSQTVLRKALTLSTPLSVPGSKVYDGTTVAVVSGTPALQGSEAFGAGSAGDGKPYTGDTVSLVGTVTGTYNSKDVASASTVTYGGLSLSGAQVANYTLTLQSPDSATITTKALTVSSPAVTTKPYDGGVTATPTGSLQTAEAGGTGTTGDGKPYTGDTLTLSATGTFDTRNVGTGKAVASTYTLGGAQVTDYLLTQPTGLTGTINPTNLTVTAADNTKDYDGTTNAAATPTITSGAIQTGDTAPAWAETYDTKHVGTGKTLTPAGLVNDGNSGTNYNYTYATVATGVINQTNLTVTAATNTKVYDGTTNAAATPTITAGAIQTGDTANFAEAYDNPNVGTGKTLIPSGSVTDGNTGANYNVAFVNDTTGVITAPCSQTNALLSITDNLDGTFGLAFVGTPQAVYYVLTQTNLAEAMANWTPLAGSTNTVTNLSGLWSFTVTNTLPQSFYRSAATTICP